MGNKLLIDGDFILYKILSNKKQTSEEIEKYGDYNNRSFEEIQKGLNWYLEEKIFKPTEATEYIGFVGGIGNFRKLISPEYKANRVDFESPRYFWESKQYLADIWGFHKIDNIESEDAVGICLTKYSDSILVYTDHDLNQLPGKRYNPVKEEFSEVSEYEALEFFNWFQLSGCYTDKVLGLKKGIGESKAKKLLENIPLEKQLYEILNLFMLEYGEYDGIDKFATNYKLLKILRKKSDFIIPEFTKLDINLDTNPEEFNF